MATPNKAKTFVLAGYNIIGLIGKGSFSEVYEGTEKVTGGKVAVKVIGKKNLTKGKVDDIVSEIGIMKSLDHPNIVRMLDFIWDEKNVYIVLEYCEGGNLSQYIKRLVKLPEAVCKRAIQQLAMGLAYLRLKEISHMDLKPQNLLVKFKPFTVKIADFGLSQHLSEEIYAESIRGSPLYMAPEVLLKKTYNYKVDLWSVGIILYECLFGKTPFSNKNCRQLIEVLQQAIPIKYPTSVAVSEECIDLLKGLLKHDPNERMNFDDFFNHPFVDLIHAPTEENKKLAIHIIHEAVKYDEQKKYPEAFSSYCRALRYMVPFLNSLRRDSYEWDKMQLKVIQCLNRAEELKVFLAKYDNQSADIEKYWKSNSKSTSKELESIWKKNFVQTGKGIAHLIPSTSFEGENENTPLSEVSVENSENSLPPDLEDIQSETTSKESSHSNDLQSSSECHPQKPLDLKSLFQSTPKVCDALEIGATGQMYMAEGDYKSAYDKFESSLNILIPQLKREPPGPRRALLVRQVQWWLTQAESAKGLSAASQINAEISTQPKTLETSDNCSIQ